MSIPRPTEEKQISTPLPIPSCPCRTKVEGKEAQCLVNYYSDLLERSGANIDKMLFKKQALVNRLQARMNAQLSKIEANPGQDLSLKEYQFCQSLREEVDILVGVFMIIEELHSAYLIETGNMAVIYWKLWVDYHQLRKEKAELVQTVAELRHDLSFVNEHCNTWIELYCELKQQQSNG